MVVSVGTLASRKKPFVGEDKVKSVPAIRVADAIPRLLEAETTNPRIGANRGDGSG